MTRTRYSWPLAILTLFALCLAALPFASEAPSAVPRKVVVTIPVDSLDVGDSVKATAIPKDTRGYASPRTQLAEWVTSPAGCLAIVRYIDTYRQSAMVQARTAGRCTVSATGTGTFVGITGSDSVVIRAPGPPPAPAPSGTSAQLISVTGGCIVGTTLAIASSCPATDTTTRFTVPDSVGPIGAPGGVCLADSATTKVVRRSCDGSAGQQWRRAGYTSAVRHVASGLCLAKNASSVSLAACNGEAYEAWTSEPIQSGSSGGGGSTPTPPASTCTAADSAVARQSHPNEPAGMTPLHTHAGLVVTPCGWGNASGTISVIDDATKGKVLQLTMSPTATPGSGTARVDTDPEISAFGATRIYIAFWEKLSPSFKGNNGSGSLKNLIVHTQSTYGGLPNGAFHLPALISDPANPDGRIRIYDSFINVTDFDGRHHDPANNDQVYSADAGDIFARGTWHFVENVVDLNSQGQINGSVKTWVDGVLAASASGIKQSYDGMARLTGIELTNVWGGGGTAIPADNWYRFKDLYVSGGFARSGEQPARWVLTSQEGTSVSVGSTVHLTAQLVDQNGNPVDICGLQPTLTTTNTATWSLWDGVLNGTPLYPNASGCEHGRQLFQVTVSSGGTTLTATDYATVWNGQRGTARTGSLTITTR